MKLSPLKNQKIRQINKLKLNKPTKKQKKRRKRKKQKSNNKRPTTHIHKQKVNPVKSTPFVKVSLGVFDKRFLFASINKALRKKCYIIY